MHLVYDYPYCSSEYFLPLPSLLTLLIYLVPFFILVCIIFLAESNVHIQWGNIKHSIRCDHWVVQAMLWNSDSIHQQMARCPCGAAPESICAPLSTRLREKLERYRQRHRDCNMAVSTNYATGVHCGMAAWSWITRCGTSGSEHVHTQHSNKMASFTDPSNGMCQKRLAFCTLKRSYLFCVRYGMKWIYVLTRMNDQGSHELALESWKTNLMTNYIFTCLILTNTNIWFFVVYYIYHKILLISTCTYSERLYTPNKGYVHMEHSHAHKYMGTWMITSVHMRVWSS